MCTSAKSRKRLASVSKGSLPLHFWQDVTSLVGQMVLVQKELYNASVDFSVSATNQA